MAKRSVYCHPVLSFIGENERLTFRLHDSTKRDLESVCKRNTSILSLVILTRNDFQSWSEIYLNGRREWPSEGAFDRNKTLNLRVIQPSYVFTEEENRQKASRIVNRCSQASRAWCFSLNHQRDNFIKHRGCLGSDLLSSSTRSTCP